MQQLLSKTKYFIFVIVFIFIYSINTTVAQAQRPNLNLSDQMEEAAKRLEDRLSTEAAQQDSGVNPNNSNIGNLGASAGRNVSTNPVSNSASGSKYKPITPGYQTFFDGRTGLGGMIETIFTVSITITIVLAVIMMIVGGIQYMGSESVFAKGAGKDKIYAALGGLLIALVSILMISTILPSKGDGTKFIIDIFG